MYEKTRITTKLLPPRHFSIKVTKRYVRRGIHFIDLHVHDKYWTKRYALERTVFRRFVDGLEGYLRKHPTVNFKHPKNIARKLIYMPRSVKAWTQYMPGGFATHYVHNPEHRRLMDGTRVGYITRNLFRHSIDAIGLRARADTMAWFAKEHTAAISELKWISIASGTGQATYDSVRYLAKPTEIYLIDIDQASLDFAKQLAGMYGFAVDAVHIKKLDIRHSAVYEKLLQSVRPHVVEAMGIVEYLNEYEAASLVRRTLQGIATGGIFVFTNMLPSHPHLQVHKRGVGWPGVIQRTTDEVLDLLEELGVDKHRISVMLPDDGVYAVYAITV